MMARALAILLGCTVFFASVVADAGFILPTRAVSCRDNRLSVARCLYHQASLFCRGIYTSICPLGPGSDLHSKQKLLHRFETGNQWQQTTENSRSLLTPMQLSFTGDARAMAQARRLLIQPRESVFNKLPRGSVFNPPGPGNGGNMVAGPPVVLNKNPAKH